MLEDLWLNDVAADNRQCRRRRSRFGLLDDTLRPDQPAIVGNDVEHAIASGLLAGHLGHRHQVAAGLVIGLDHLRQARRVAYHQIVGEQHGERLVADETARAPYGMAEAERHLLPGISDLPGLG